MDDLWYFYCGGRRLIELLVAIHSLRQFYTGRIGVALDPVATSLLPPLPADVEIQFLPEIATTGQGHMSNRWQGLKLFKYDRVIASDTDIVVNRSINRAFEVIHPDPDYITVYTPPIIEPHNHFFVHKYFRRIDRNYPKTDTYMYVYMGLFAIHHDYPHIDWMTKLCKQMDGQRCYSEEYSISYICHLTGRKVFWSDKELWIRATRYFRSDPIIWHAIKERYRIAGAWRKAWYAARDANFMNLGDPEVAELVEPGIGSWPLLV